MPKVSMHLLSKKEKHLAWKKKFYIISSVATCLGSDKITRGKL